MIKVGRGHNDLGTVGLQHINLFLTHLVRDGEDTAVAPNRRRHRQSKPGIARGALNYGAAWLQQARFLGPFHHVDGHAVLD